MVHNINAGASSFNRGIVPYIANNLLSALLLKVINSAAACDANAITTLKQFFGNAPAEKSGATRD